MSKLKAIYLNPVQAIPLQREYLETVVTSTLAFFLPFLLGHPQILVGTLVNAFLINAALNFKAHKVLPLILLPSLALLSRGLIFGPFTPLLVYMIPFIWVSNALLVYGMRYLSQTRGFGLSLLGGTCLKVAFLFSLALIFWNLQIIPQAFLLAMGPLQLVTALLGGVLVKVKHRFG